MKACTSLSVDQTEAQQWVWRLAEAAISRTTETAAHFSSVISSVIVYHGLCEP